jgi:DNA-binding XRE family transcriptional regulator
VVRILVAPQTVGGHIRRRRLGLKLLQQDVAERLGVNKTSVFNWEANTSTPEIRYMPAIIEFPGYDPFPAAKVLVEPPVHAKKSRKSDPLLEL